MSPDTHLLRLVVAAVRHADAFGREDSDPCDRACVLADEDLTEAAYQYAKGLSAVDRRRLGKVPLR